MATGLDLDIMSVSLTPTANGIVFRVKATPGARRNEIGGEHNGALKVSVTQVAERGKANQAIIRLLCDQLYLRKSQIQLIRGASTSDKQYLVDEIELSELQQRIDRAAGS